MTKDANEFVSILLGEKGEELQQDLISSLESNKAEMVKGNTEAERARASSGFSQLLMHFAKSDINPIAIVQEAREFLVQLEEGAKQALTTSTEEMKAELMEALEGLIGMLEKATEEKEKSSPEYTEEQFRKDLLSTKDPVKLFDVIKRGADAGHHTLH